MSHKTNHRLENATIDFDIPSDLGLLFSDFDSSCHLEGQETCAIVEYKDNCVTNQNTDTTVDQTDSLMSSDEFEPGNTLNPLTHRVVERRGKTERTSSQSQYNFPDVMCISEGF